MRQSKHDPCVFMRDHKVRFEDDAMITKASEIVLEVPSTGLLAPTLDLMLSVHVDDNLATGMLAELERMLAILSKEFTEYSLEKNHFKHYGVDVWRDPVKLHLYDSQQDYLDAIPEIKLPAGRFSKEALADDALVTEFRSVVAGIAWVGVSYGPAGAAGSLFQGFLPHPTLGQCVQVNDVLNQLRTEYRPTIYRSDLKLPLCINSVSDSSLANNSKKSQGGIYELLSSASEEFVCGPCNMLATKSAKSKRVASSTSHTETLSAVAGLEEACFLQTWLQELQTGPCSALQLIEAIPVFKIRFL